ncbi:class I SAM-dependent methyltransferase [Pedobacter nyackensis]|uniref:Methyltransferase FkbM domain-containing protein n=1 Tax=Pedobacter nyackensis TaxID=475255 RepID=A0A1W2AKJ3_9SPHI|nr:FkbM family methyltransferase [Pedobacter nyackensis]SMC61050.1 Methyltransferase FkbM domain-containing protein [Pedobacter nyackensis]
MEDINFLKPISIKHKVRLGPNMDGGYVIYEPVLSDIDALVTYGVGWEVGFEEHFNEITGRRVVMFDPTMFGKYILDFKLFKALLQKGLIKAVFEYSYFVWETWTELNKLRRRKIIFVNEGIGIKCSEKYNTLENHLKQHQLIDKQILLKIDIEGDEYSVFENNDTFDHFKNVNQMIIEFHNLHVFFPRFKKIICRLREDYEIVHIHGNNWGGEFSFTDLVEDNTILIPKVLEVTLVQKGRIRQDDIVEESSSNPSENLDYPNNPNSHDLSLNYLLINNC